MNKFLGIAVLVALLSLSANSFRVLRQVEEEEEGTMTRITHAVKTYYSRAMDTANGYLETIKGMKLDEKAKNLYQDTANIISTYFNIAQDQAYHILYPQQ
ncbi:apolipoprotein C-II [Pholidichthys leucotaenia]